MDSNLRFHPEDLSELGDILKKEIRQLYSRENIIKDMITLTVDEVCVILQKDPSTILRYLNKGIITGFKSGKEWRVTQQSLNNHINGTKK